MSSKSRKHSQKGARRPQQDDPLHGHGAQPGQGGEEHAEPTAEDFLEAEELLKTPKGRSPMVYGSLILLLIFLLVVFVAGDAIWQMQSRRPSFVAMRWEHPQQGPIEVTAQELGEAREMLRFTAGRLVEEEEAAQFLVLDRLTRDAGVRVGTAELVERLQTFVEAMGGIENYRQSFRRFPGNVAGFEAFVQRQLAVGRLEAIVRQFSSVPSVDDITEAWANQRQLYTFDYTFADPADFLEQAAYVPPSEEELQTWFDALPIAERREYEIQASRRVELIGALMGDAERSFDALLAAYPDTEEVDAEARAREYYERSYFVRFRRPEPISEDDPDAPEDLNARLYFTFEEVQEQLLVESAVKAAIDRWREDLSTRLEAGETVELAAEAERLGLDYEAPEESLTQLELRGMEGLGGIYIAGSMFGLPEAGDLTAGVTIGQEGFTVGRVNEIIPASSPAASEIREQLLEAYTEDRAAELAEQALKDLRAQFETATDDTEAETEGLDAPALTADFESFSAAVEAAGFPVERITDFDRAAPRPDEPTPVEEYLRSSFQVYGLEEGEIDEARKSFSSERFFLVRLDGKRDPDMSEMEAGDFQRLLQSPPPSAFLPPFGLERLREDFGLWLYSDEDEDAEGAQTPATEAGA